MTKSKNALDGFDQEQYSAEQSEINLARAHTNTCWPSAQLIDVPEKRRQTLLRTSHFISQDISSTGARRSQCCER